MDESREDEETQILRKLSPLEQAIAELTERARRDTNQELTDELERLRTEYERLVAKRQR